MSGRSRSPLQRKPVHQPPVLQPVIKPPGFLSVVKDGFALGLGASVARTLVDRAFTPTPLPSRNPYSSCDTLQEEFDSCVQRQMPSETCKQQLDVLNICFKNLRAPSGHS